jgi:hypothetical protein
MARSRRLAHRPEILADGRTRDFGCGWNMRGKTGYAGKIHRTAGGPWQGLMNPAFQIETAAGIASGG